MILYLLFAEKKPKKKNRNMLSLQFKMHFIAHFMPMSLCLAIIGIRKKIS